MTIHTEEAHEHITKGHDIMSKNIAAIGEAILKPTAVFQSNEWVGRDVYFGKNDSAYNGKDLYTKVIVHKPTEYNTEGNVVSAWPQKDISVGNTQNSYGCEIFNGLVILKDLETEAITGITIFDFERRNDSGALKELPIPIKIDFNKEFFSKLKIRK